MTHMLKAGLCWVEYIFSIRGLFLPTVSWNLAGGEDGMVGEQHVGGWAPWRLFPRGFSLWTCAFSELCFHRQNSVDIYIFVLNLVIGIYGIFKHSLASEFRLLGDIPVLVGLEGGSLPLAVPPPPPHSPYICAPIFLPFSLPVFSKDFCWQHFQPIGWVRMETK